MESGNEGVDFVNNIKNTMTTLADATRQLTNTQDLMTLGEIGEKIKEVQDEYIKQERMLQETNFFQKRTHDEYPLDPGIIDGSIKELNNVNVKELRLGPFESYPNLLNLERIILPNCERIVGSSKYNYQFTGLQHLSYVNIGLKKVTNYDFWDLPSLITLELPECEELGSGTISFCSVLENLSLPVCKKIEAAFIGDIGGLKTLTLPACEYIGAGAFKNTKNLASIFLPGSTLCFLENSNAISNYIAASGENWEQRLNKRVYVPQSMLESYKTFGEWSKISYCLFPIEEVN